MKNLTKLIAALVAIFATIVMSTTSTHAASSIDVYCDGIDDQDKISAVLVDDATINIHNDCVFTSALQISGSGITLQGEGNTIFGALDDIYLIRLSYGAAATVSDMILELSDSFNIYYALFLSPSDFNLTTLNVNNVTINKFPMGISLAGMEGSVSLTASGLVVTNTSSVDVGLGFDINIAILSGGNNVMNWVSGRSDAEYAIFQSDFPGYTEMDDISEVAKKVIINENTLSGSDFVSLSDDVRSYGTISPINHLVNCGFPVGSEWDICTNTGGEEPEDGNNGNEIEAPGTGVNFGNNQVILIGCILTVIAGSMLVVQKKL